MDNQYLMISKLLIAVGICICLYLVVKPGQDAYNVYKDLQLKASQLESSKTKLEELRVKKEQNDKIEKANTKPVYKNDVEVNDRMSSFGVMFEDVIQSAKYNGLKLRSIEYEENPPYDSIATLMPAEYNVCAIKMQLIGSYVQFRSYFQDIYNYPYVMNIDKISIKPYEKNKKVIIADLVVVLYSAKTDAQKAAYASEQSAAQALEGGDQKASGSGLDTAVAQ